MKDYAKRSLNLNKKLDKRSGVLVKLFNLSIKFRQIKSLLTRFNIQNYGKNNYSPFLYRILNVSKNFSDKN